MLKSQWISDEESFLEVLTIFESMLNLKFKSIEKNGFVKENSQLILIMKIRRTNSFVSNGYFTVYLFIKRQHDIKFICEQRECFINKKTNLFIFIPFFEQWWSKFSICQIATNERTNQINKAKTCRSMCINHFMILHILPARADAYRERENK